MFACAIITSFPKVLQLEHQQRQEAAKAARRASAVRRA